MIDKPLTYEEITHYANKFEDLCNEKDKEIEKLKELVIVLWHNDNARFLNKEQIDLLNNIVFGNDEEDLGDDKE